MVSWSYGSIRLLIDSYLKEVNAFVERKQNSTPGKSQTSELYSGSLEKERRVMMLVTEAVLK